MCGIIFAASTSPVTTFVEQAHQRQRHRGPDGEGLHFDQIGGTYLGFAHQRLAILDLSEKGAQPMSSSSGNNRIIFNGEIYNYRELAAQYGLAALKSGTDTEVAIELIERLGIEGASNIFNGMWSIIVHDRAADRVYISRDRFGKKPLYYAKFGNGLFFASELHSLLLHPSAPLAPDPTVASRYLSQSLLDIDDRSWVKGINSFPAGSVAEIDVRNPEKGILNLRPFWSINSSVQTPARGSHAALLEEVRATVEDAIKLRLHADVPLGIALSGGLDSSIIASIASRQAESSSIHLFSATNPGAPEDESEFVLEMARHLNVNVTQFSLANNREGLFELLLECTSHNDGPIASFSNVLFYKLMEAAKSSDITVVLTGQGADEVFCGYRKYPVLALKKLLSDKKIFKALRFGANVLKRGTVLKDFSFSEAKRYLGKSNLSILGPHAIQHSEPVRLAAFNNLTNRQIQDINHYSVPYLCHYEDRMSMAWSREVRTPFLDYRLVDLGLRLPEDFRMYDGWTKYPLRKAFAKDLPKKITWRKDKKGFVNPQDSWLRQTLRQNVLELMSAPSAAVYQEGLVDRTNYLNMFDAYCKGNNQIWFRDVFAPFSLEIWLRRISRK